MTGLFTTASLGVIPDAGGDVDAVLRRQAWEEAHPGGTIARERPDQLVYTARWPDGSVAATAYASLSVLMGRLDQAEDECRCPVHGTAS